MIDDSQKLSFFTVGELAKMLGVGANTVLKWIHDQELRASNISPQRGSRPRWRISAKDLEDFLAARAALQEV